MAMIRPNEKLWRAVPRRCSLSPSILWRFATKSTAVLQSPDSRRPANFLDIRVGPKTEVAAFPEHVRCSPNNRHSSRRTARLLCAITKLMHRSKRPSLLDHLVGGDQQARWHSKTKCLGGLKVDHQLEFGGKQHWQIGRPSTFENSTCVRPSL